MVDLQALEHLVNRYVDCWRSQRPTYTGIFEDNDFGCEGLQVFRNDFQIEAFTHHELCQLATLLTRSLRGQTNSDHKQFWSWCAFLPLHFDNEVGLFLDHNWVQAFRSLVNLMLAATRRFPAGSMFLNRYREALNHVNSHLMNVAMDKQMLGASHGFAVLEGLLRRKSQNYIGNDGIVLKPFQVTDPGVGSKTFEAGGRLNRIRDGLRLFEEVTTRDRNRACPALQDLSTEIAALYPNTGDVFELVDSWRNELLHGQEYWTNRVPIILNLVCLLAIDEIEPAVYDSKKADLKAMANWTVELQKQATPLHPSQIFPPDL